MKLVSDIWHSDYITQLYVLMALRFPFVKIGATWPLNDALRKLDVSKALSLLHVSSAQSVGFPPEKHTIRLLKEEFSIPTPV